MNACYQMVNLLDSVLTEVRYPVLLLKEHFKKEPLTKEPLTKEPLWKETLTKETSVQFVNSAKDPEALLVFLVSVEKMLGDLYEKIQEGEFEKNMAPYVCKLLWVLLGELNPTLVVLNQNKILHTATMIQLFN